MQRLVFAGRPLSPVGRAVPHVDVPPVSRLDARRLLWNDVLMLDLDGALVRAIREALVAEGIEPGEPVRVERPADMAHGDRATNIAMQTAKKAGRAPRELAESLRARLTASPTP